MTRALASFVLMFGFVSVAGAAEGAGTGTGTGTGTELISLTYERIPQMVSERNGHVHGAELRERSTHSTFGSLRRSFLPRLEAGVGFESFTTGPFSRRQEPYGFLDARLNLYNGDRDRLRESALIEDARIASTERSGVVADEISKARKLYWNLVSIREELKLFEDALVSNSRYIQSATKRIRAGVGTETDRIEFELARLQLDQDVERKKLQSKTLERELAVILGYPAGTELGIPDSITHEHNDELLKKPIEVESHRAVVAERSQSQAFALRSSIAERTWWPSLDLLASHRLYTFREREYDDRDDRWESVIGVELRFELFDGFASRVEAEALAYQAEAFERKARQTAAELSAEIETARAELVLTHRLIHDSETNLSKTKSYLVKTLDEYRRGVKSSPDVLNAAERYFDIQRRYLELRRDYQLARVDLLNRL